MLKKIFPAITIFCFIMAFTATAQSLESRIATAFKAFQSDPKMANGIAAFSVIDANTGKVIFSENGHTGMATASTLKTITSATAFSILGADFTYETSLQYTGTIDHTGVLSGDIIIKGTGDPTLGSDRYDATAPELLLNQWVDAIRNAGIRRIDGCIVGDDLLWDGHRAPSGWTWGDMGNYYGAGVSALNWRENAFKILMKPGAAAGDKADFLGTKPDRSYLKFNNEVRTGARGTGDRLYAFSAPYSTQILLDGTYALDLKKEIELSSPDPAYDVALALQIALEKQGIGVRTPATTGYLLKKSGSLLPSARKTIYKHKSPPLSEICYWFNRKSINLYGEALLKTVASSSGEKYATADAAEFEREYWCNALGLSPGALQIRDGSGLSPENRVTTLAMATILNHIKAKPWFGLFYEGLPIYNHMKMKSGTISGVLGYAGYQTSSHGQPLVFSFLISNYQGSASAMRQRMFTMLNVLK